MHVVAPPAALWCDSYVRATKTKGKPKNLRCFPTHKTGGHTTAGFCGADIVVAFPPAMREFVTFFGFLCPFDSPIPTTFDADTATDVDAIEGAVSDEGRLRFTRYGWAYAWRSSRFHNSTLHVFRVIAVDGTRTVVGHCDSSSFTVVSPPRQEGKKRSAAAASADVAVTLGRRESIAGVLPSRSLSKRTRAELSLSKPSQSLLDAREPTNDIDLALVFRVMQERIDSSVDADSLSQTSSESRSTPLKSEFGWDEHDVLSLAASSMRMSARTEGKLLALEALDGLLLRIFAAVKGWIGRNGIRASNPDEEFLGLLETSLLVEGRSIATTANEIRQLIATAIPPPRVALSIAEITRLVHVSRIELGKLTLLADGLAKGGRNDVTGCWRPPKRAVGALSMERECRGMSYCEREFLKILEADGIHDIEVLDADRLKFNEPRIGRDVVWVAGQVQSCSLSSSARLDLLLFPVSHSLETLCFFTPTAAGFAFITIGERGQYIELKLLERAADGRASELLGRIVLLARQTNHTYSIVIDAVTSFARHDVSSNASS